MLKKFLRINLIIAAFIPFALMATTDKTNNKVTAPTYNEEKLNISVDAKHPQFDITLKSNPTTGFSWFLREYDANIINPVKHNFIAPTQKLMGASGFEAWTFRIKPAGFTVPHQTTIRFVYARPWQGADNSTEIIFHVTTVVPNTQK